MNPTKADKELSPHDVDNLQRQTWHRRTQRTSKDSSADTFGQDPADAQYDGGLAVSQILAVMALGVAALLWFFPHPITLFAGSWTIVVLFVFNSLNQKHQRNISWQRADWRSRPSNSNLWICGLPLIMGAVALAFVGDRILLFDQSVLARWGAVVLFTTSSGALLANKSLQGKLNDKYLGVLTGVIFGGALATLTVFAGIAILSGHYWECSPCLALPLIGIWYCYDMTKRLLLRVERDKAFSVFCHSFFGAAAVFALAVAPEVRDLGISIGERAADSSDQMQTDLGLGLLSLLSAQRDIEQDCNPGTAPLRSLVSALTPVSTGQANKIYFLLTGKAGFLSPSPVTGEDPLKGESTVGAVRKGLSLQDSLLTGHVDTNSLTSALYWTMVFHNQTEGVQEARATIALPVGSAVSRVTLWVNGVPQEAAFNSTARVKQAYQWIVQRNRDPLLVTETAPNQVTLQAFPVPKWGEMKVRFGITCPLQPQSRRSFNFEAPHLVAANFDYKNASTEVKLESDGDIDANIEHPHMAKTNASHILTGSLKVDGDKGYFFNSSRATDFNQITTRASHSAEDSVICERLQSTPREALNRLAVVVEANTLLADQKKDLTSWLQNLPHNLEAKAIIAGRHESATPMSISELIGKLNTIKLDAGTKDSAALAQAKDFIGREKHAAILWIHGPQPIVFQDEESDLKSLMDRGSRRLKIYDCQLGGPQANELANYMSKLDANACPKFITVGNSRSLKNRLDSLEQNQFAAGDDFVVERQKVHNSHKQEVVQNFPTVSRVSSIWAADEARKCVNLGDSGAAIMLGTAYRVVTPVTGAVVMETQRDYQYQHLSRDFYNVVSAKTHAPAGTADGTSTLANATPDANLFSNGMFSSAPRATAAPSASPAMQSPLASAIGALNSFGVRDANLFDGGSGGNAYDMSVSVSVSQAAPSLQGATNGTIGPQGNDVTIGPQGIDATSVTGVNSSGTVRVNNLANLEAILYMIPNGLLALGLIWGTVTLLMGVFGRSCAINAKRLMYGSMAILFGLLSPVTVSYLLGWARDANLFS